MHILLIIIGKLLSLVSSNLGIGSGSTWPGHIALETNKNFIRQILSRNKNLKIILVAGTNGKTTTSKLIRTILENTGRKVFQNEAGANLLNGLASSLILNSTSLGKLNYDYAIFEIDENSLPTVLEDIEPDIIVLLDLFRDQLDRYGEVNIVADKWRKALSKIDPNTKLILNADDPKIAYLGANLQNVRYFGVKGESKAADHASDSSYCPKCGTKLNYRSYTFSHLGDWSCSGCNLRKPKAELEKIKSYPLPGLYNQYNIHAALLTGKALGIPTGKLHESLDDFKPAFGRQEIVEYKNRKIQIFLSKNPASFNQSLQAISELKAKHVLFVLNDRIPDGRDVSWIWDVDFETHLDNFESVSVSGDRVYDMALRVQYANNESRITNHDAKTYGNLEESIKKSVSDLPEDQTLYILPTYSAMLDLRKILTGKAIL